MPQKNIIRSFAKRLISPSKVIERAKNIRRIEETKRVASSLRPADRVALLTKSGKRIKGRVRGYAGEELFLENKEGGLVSIHISKIERLNALKSNSKS